MTNLDIKKSTGHLSSQDKNAHKLVLEKVKHCDDWKANAMLRPVSMHTSTSRKFYMHAHTSNFNVVNHYELSLRISNIMQVK